MQTYRDMCWYDGKSFLFGYAAMLLTLGCDGPVVGPPPPGGYSEKVVSYDAPPPSSNAKRIELAAVELADAHSPDMLTFPKSCRVGEEFVLAGKVIHPDSRILSVLLRAEFWVRGTDGTRIDVGAKQASAKLIDKAFPFEVTTKIPSCLQSRLFMDLVVDTIQPGYDGNGLPEPWIVRIANSEIEVDHLKTTVP